MRVLTATTNEGKAREIRRLLAGIAGGEACEILSLADLARLWRSETLGGLPPVNGGEAGEAEIRERYAVLREAMSETGSTFEENAVIKATGAAKYTGLLTLADDSGLETDWLDGAPGVYSARYAGSGGDEQACNDLLLANMLNAPEGGRTARYVAVLVLAASDEILYQSRGVCEGYIGFAPRGEGGFGYDPLFVLPGGTTTMAELSMEEKNKISHRGIALAQMLPVLADLYKNREMRTKL